MISSGLVSISFRNLNVEQIISLVSQAGLKGIEWGGDVHVPHGDIECARTVGQATRQAGLSVAAYGSYYRAGVSEGKGLAFADVLASAEALETSIIRVWAGNVEPQDARADDWQAVVDDSKRIAAMAADKDITIVYEFHDGTLNKTNKSCRELLEKVDCPNVQTYWQPRHGLGGQRNCAELQTLMDRLYGVHVFHWWPDHTARHLLADGKDDWQEYFKIIRTCPRDIFALLEFAKDDSAENCQADARVLQELLVGT